jgi:hypothetical protein
MSSHIWNIFETIIYFCNCNCTDPHTKHVQQFHFHFDFDYIALKNDEKRFIFFKPSTTSDDTIVGRPCDHRLNDMC